MDTKQLLLELCAVDGVSGRESEAANLAAELLRPYGEVSVSTLGSVVCTARKPQPGGPHILLDAHIDEIGMIVTTVDKETGFLRVAPCGGIDRRLLIACPVTVYTQTGPIPGVVCSIPPHLIEGEAKNPKVDEIYIDTGLSGPEAAETIFPGNIVTIRSTPCELLSDLVSSKALDDRAGCAVHLKVLEYLGSTPLSCGLTVQFSTMEEVGSQGARTAAFEANPTHSIAVDVSFAYTPDARREKTGDLKKGPMIGFAPILNPTMSQELVQTAEEHNIPFQREVMGGRTGTTADVIAVVRDGVITGLVSVPQKYMHTPIETVAVQDVEDSARLIAAYIKKKWRSAV